MSLPTKSRRISIGHTQSTYPFITVDFEMTDVRTWLRQGYKIRDVLHEDPSLELELGFPTFIDELLIGELVLGFAEVDVFAAEEDSFEKVHVILKFRNIRVSKDPGL